MRASEVEARELNPPAFLQLAGHSVRWRLLGELSRSDRMVHELTDLVGAPQNLVSYHLAKLRDAGLVSARRSSADGRDAYYTADLVRLGSLLDTRADLLDLDPQLDRAYDRYAFVRNAWLQRREFQVTDGEIEDSALELEEGMEEEPLPEDEPVPEESAPAEAAPPAEGPDSGSSTGENSPAPEAPAPAPPNN